MDASGAMISSPATETEASDRILPWNGVPLAVNDVKVGNPTSSMFCCRNERRVSETCSAQPEPDLMNIPAWLKPRPDLSRPLRLYC